MKKINISKKWALTGALLLLCFAGTAAAYLMDGDSADNRILVGSNTVDIIEEFDPPEELQPNSSFKKDVKVKNTGISDCYVRVMVKFTDMDMGKWCELNLSSEWIYGEDGYYYYPKLLKSGGITPSLFTTVKIGNVPAEQIKAFDIIVYAESVQVIGETTSDYKETWTAYQQNKERR